MSQDTFRPFETALPMDDALSVLQGATDGADDGEVFVERRKSESLVFDDGRLRSASYDASEGFGLRAVHGDVTGYAHSTEVSIPAMKRAVLRLNHDLDKVLVDGKHAPVLPFPTEAIIGGDGKIGACGLHLIADLHELSVLVGPAHGLEDAIRATLHGEVDVGTELG